MLVVCVCVRGGLRPMIAALPEIFSLFRGSSLFQLSNAISPYHNHGD